MVDGSNYVIELAGKAAGLVVKEGNRYRFYASENAFSDLERSLYRSPAEAEDACRRLLWPGRAPRPLTQRKASSNPFTPRSTRRRLPLRHLIRSISAHRNIYADISRPVQSRCNAHFIGSSRRSGLLVGAFFLRADYTANVVIFEQFQVV